MIAVEELQRYADTDGGDGIARGCILLDAGRQLDIWTASGDLPPQITASALDFGVGASEFRLAASR